MYFERSFRPDSEKGVERLKKNFKKNDNIFEVVIQIYGSAWTGEKLTLGTFTSVVTDCSSL